ncbi:MAG: ATP-dependent zinc metalloprotease FtsH [Alphaproteobacteria bacterium]|nr:ATP-dependent zinc metalloprotease FtsH [Alphaproteobacteria bacterium]MBL0717940.1 ATP-dependent zinc metalloprotease FtsH [Alphaproteobacteria bacterium]
MNKNETSNSNHKVNTINESNSSSSRKWVIIVIISFLSLIIWTLVGDHSNNKPAISLFNREGSNQQSVEDKPVGKGIFNLQNRNSAKEDKKAIENLSFSQFIKLVEQNKIQSIKISKEQEYSNGILTDGSKFKTIVIPSNDLIFRLNKAGIDVAVKEPKLKVGSMIINILTFMFMMLMVIWLFKLLKGAKSRKGTGGIGGSMMESLGGKFSPAIIKDKKTFKDVVGIPEAIEEVEEIVDFLQNSEKFSRLGARIPKGILFSGLPGTGKTLLARAIAGEAKVPFFSATGSEFNGMIVGLGVSRIKTLFATARKSSPCLIFIDEIDAIGQQRGRGTMSSDMDREATLNQLLAELDGFDTESGVILIGATNRPEILDKALLRPGRFDRQVYIDLPKMIGRKEIIELYAKKLKIDKSVDLGRLAKITTGFSGAEIENVLNEAAIIGSRENNKFIVEENIESAFDKIVMGHERKNKTHKEDIPLIAYHEAGHALTHILLEKEGIDPIHKVTILQRGRALGFVSSRPDRDKVSLPIKQVKAELVSILSGRVAEEIIFGKDAITTGASSDIQMASNLARRAVTEWGFSKKVGMINVMHRDHYGQLIYPLSNDMLKKVDSEVDAIIDTAYKKSTQLLTKNKVKLKLLADSLLKHETLSGDEVSKILKSGKIPPVKISKAVKIKVVKQKKKPSMPSSP